MNINTNSKKILLSIMIAFGGVLWLNVWHNLGSHSHGTIFSAPLLQWGKDAFILLLPILGAIWAATMTAQGLVNRSNKQISIQSQWILTAGVVAVFTTTVFILMESIHGFETGIGRDLLFLVSICRNPIYYINAPVLGTLVRSLPNAQIPFLYVLLQDGLTVALVNLGITILLMIAQRELENQLSVAAVPSQNNPSEQDANPWRVNPVAMIAFAVVVAYGGNLWLSFLHKAGQSTWLRDSSILLPLIILAVLFALRLVHPIFEHYGDGASKVLKGAVAASIIGLTTSAALGLGTTITNIWFRTHHQLASSELSPLLHWGTDALFSLMVNIVLASGVYILVRGNLWFEKVRQPIQWRLPYPQLSQKVTAIGVAIVMIPSLLGLASSTTAALAVAPSPCLPNAPVKTFDVSAIDINMWLNRFGDHDPNAQMYVLNSAISAVRAQEVAGPSSLSTGLADDPIQPLAIRANEGDCVVINFTNSTARPAPQGGTTGTTTNTYGIHIDGLAYQMSSSGDNVGNNGNSAVAQGASAQYVYYIPIDPTLEGAHYIHPGPGNRQAVAHGLFGTLNVEPVGSTYLNMTTGLPQLSGWEATIVPGTGAAFRENVMVFHEIGNESERDYPKDINGGTLPTIDPHTGAYRPNSRAINYRTEAFMDRLNFAPDQKSVVYGSYTFGDTTNIIPRGYLADPTKFRLVHGGSEVFHVFHLHGGSDRWRFNPMADPTYNYAQTGLDKHPVEIQSESARLDSQSMGPGESFDLEIENGAGGAQQGAGEFLFHCHIAHHYFAGMWGYWRVYDTLQPDLMPLPDRTPLPQAVDSSALVGQTIYGQTITAANLDAWIRPLLPTQGMTHDINVATLDTADQDASVWDWSVDPASGMYLGEPDRLFTFQANGNTKLWPDYENKVPGHPQALLVDQTVQSTYLLNGQPVNFTAGGYVGDRPKLLFNPTNGRPAWPMLRPHIGKRPPFSPNGHSGAPYLGEYGGQTANPILPVGTTSTQAIDPWANRPDGICPAAAPLRKFNIVGIAVPIQVTNPAKSNVVDKGGALDVLAQDKDAIYAGSKVYAGVQSRESLAIRGNIGDCIGVTYVSELTDGNPELPFSKTNIHIHHVQFDTQASDGVISGFSFEQSIRPYKIVDPQLVNALTAGDTVLHLTNVAKFQNGVWIAIGMGIESIEIRQIVSIDATASTVTVSQPVNNAHAAGEWVGVEFVQYRWYPDVELDNIFFHDHVNGIHGWSHGMVGQLVIEPQGSRYFDPVSGAEIKAGAIADIHTDPACVPSSSFVSNPCSLIPGVVDGSFREFVIWTINNHEPVSVEATINLRAEPWFDRNGDPAQRFSSTTFGDPYTPIWRAYNGDPVVIRNINVGQGTNTLTIDGHRTYWEPRYVDALGVESSPINTFHSTVSEKFTLILNGGAGGPDHIPGDYIYHDGENRRFQSGAWGILRVLPGPVASLKPLPGVSLQNPAAICPAGAPQHNFAISAVDLPNTTAGGGQEGRKMAFVPTSQAAAVISGQIFPEPLVLHVAQGDCINVAFTNQRSAGKASFHLDGLLRDLNSGGINVGNNADTMVSPAGTRTYTFYADTQKLESVMISDFGGDNSGWDGLYGAMVVAPAGSTFTNLLGQFTDIGSQVNVKVPASTQNPTGQVYRDFTLLLADHDPIIGQNTMPYPASVSGPSLVNYRTAGIRVDNANMFSSAVNGDPGTPLLRAYAGDSVKVHVLGSPASEQVHVFSLGGMSWPGDMYIHNANQWQSRAVGPWEKIDINISGGAGGSAQMPGDYFYGDLRRPFNEAGMWGLFRVLPNNCSSGGTTGLICLGQIPGTSVTAISPNSGPLSGNTVVTITGTNFDTAAGATTVLFGSTPATNVSCASTTTCTATSPAGSGTVHVVVTAHGQVSAASPADQFTYLVPVPIVSSIVPNTGTISGGNSVAILGGNFSTTSGATTITFGGAPATNVTCSTTGTCTATSPAHAAGIVDVVVNVSGQSSAITNADKFTYFVPAPIVSGIVPNTGPISGGNSVTISGSNFSATAGVTVTFGGTPATGITCSTTSTCTVISPAHAAGLVDVVITVGGQSSAITNADKFTYLAPAPIVSGIVPNTGLIAGGNSVTITGSNFSTTAGATTITFGGTPATAVTCSTTSTCTVVNPAHAAGIVDVVVTVGGQSSAISTADKFTYKTLASTAVAVPVPALSKGFGYWYTFTSDGTGTISASWTTPTKVSGTLAIYSGNPFASLSNPTKTSVPTGALIKISGNKNSFSISTASLPAGQYTIYFFAGSAEPASTGQVTYMKIQ